jgi:hypothetical protein
VLSNCIHTRTTLLPELWNAFLKLTPKTLHAALALELQDVNALYSTVESLVFAQYVRRKTLQMNKVLKRGLMMGGINWAQARAPKGEPAFVFLRLCFRARSFSLSPSLLVMNPFIKSHA